MALPGWIHQYRNHESVPVVWAIVGSFCFGMMLSVKFLPTDSFWAIYSMFGMAGVYTVVYRMRGRPFLREKRGRVGSLLWTIIVMIAAGLAAYYHGSDKDGIIAMLLTAIFIFVLVEMAQPENDFGLARAFLTLPVFTMLGKFRTDGKKWIPHEFIGLFLGSLFVLLVCTVWQIILKPEEENDLVQQGGELDALNPRNANE